MSRSGWSGEATVTVRDDLGGAVAGAKVTFSWLSSRGQSGTLSCTTGTSGMCAATSATVKQNNETVRFTVSGIVTSGLAYASAVNADPDGDSNGTVLVVARPT